MAGEIVFTVPLTDAYNYTSTRRAVKSMRVLRAFLARHMKVEEGKVKVDAKLNDFMWSHGIKKPPHKVKVKASRKEDGTVLATLVEPAAKPATAAAEKKPKPAKKAAGKARAGAGDEKPVKGVKAEAKAGKE